MSEQDVLVGEKRGSRTLSLQIARSPASLSAQLAPLAHVEINRGHSKRTHGLTVLRTQKLQERRPVPLRRDRERVRHIRRITSSAHLEVETMYRTEAGNADFPWEEPVLHPFCHFDVYIYRTQRDGSFTESPSRRHNRGQLRVL